MRFQTFDTLINSRREFALAPTLADQRGKNHETRDTRSDRRGCVHACIFAPSPLAAPRDRRY